MRQAGSTEAKSAPGPGGNTGQVHLHYGGPASAPGPPEWRNKQDKASSVLDASRNSDSHQHPLR